MGARVVVFLGPTVGADEARQHLDAVYLPPAGQGDLIRAIQRYEPSAIAIIDGVFAQAPAIRHKEIVWAISSGVQVFGASSMGAIRAAELEACGMIGHGLIFRWYHRTPLADDAEVAVPMAPPELASHALGDALIDIRLTLKRAEREGIIGREFLLLLEQTARSTHFSERSYRNLLASVETRHGRDVDRLKSWLVSGAVRQKRADAISLLKLLSRQRFSRRRAKDRNFELTEAFAVDLEHSGLLDCILKEGP